MPRTARIVAVGYPHHVTQRGNNRQDVFFVDEDRYAYIEFLKQESKKHKLLILGYCLMTNHIHLIAKPLSAETLAAAVGRTHFRYAQHINRFHARSGHLWQNRFYSCALDEQHYFQAMKYIERNPVRAKLATRAWNYAWSSAAAHVGENDPSGLLDIELWKKETSAESWKRNLIRKDDLETVLMIKTVTSSGRLLGSDAFISKLETKIGRRLRPMPIGRPRKDGFNR
jgi:putative transposase